jgi:hypothetical protein
MVAARLCRLSLSVLGKMRKLSRISNETSRAVIDTSAQRVRRYRTSVEVAPQVWRHRSRDAEMES